MTAETTRAFLIVWLLILALYALVAARWYPEAMISIICQDAARDYPVLAFLAGVFVGHVWWKIY